MSTQAQSGFKGRFKVAAMTPFSRNALIVIGAVAAAMAIAPFLHLDVFGAAEMRLMTGYLVLFALAQMWNLLAGYAGIVSVGQQAYVGLGAYTFFTFAAFRDAPPLLSVLLAGVIVAIIALPTGRVVFRLKGAYFAIGTWVVAEIYRLIAAQMTVFGGGSIKSVPIGVFRSLRVDHFSHYVTIYWIALALAVGSVVLVYALLRSRFGLALAAIRDSEPGAESLGVDTAAAKRVVYIAAAFVTGMCGAVATLNTGSISANASFSLIDWTAYVIFIVVIGGVGRIEGPLVGTIVFFILRESLADLETAYLIILGALAVVVMLFAPRGLWGLVVERFGVEIFPVQRRLVVDGSESKDAPP
jgi:branched-chain amino acid transport system permease protein